MSVWWYDSGNKKSTGSFKPLCIGGHCYKPACDRMHGHGKFIQEGVPRGSVICAPVELTPAASKVSAKSKKEMLELGHAFVKF